MGGLLKSNHQTSNISRTLVGNRIVDHTDVVGATPTGDAPTTSMWSTTTSSISTSHQASIDWAKTTSRRDKQHISLVSLILEVCRYPKMCRANGINCHRVVVLDVYLNVGKLEYCKAADKIQRRSNSMHNVGLYCTNIIMHLRSSAMLLSSRITVTQQQW